MDIDTQRQRGRRIALAILAVCAAPTIAAWLAYFVWPPGSRVNYGDLIEAHRLTDPEMQRPDGRSFRLSQLRGKWLLVYADTAACSKSCREKLWYMRQVRLAQGINTDRIERVWLIVDPSLPDPVLLEEYKGMQVARVTDRRFLDELPDAEAGGDHVYVVDPLGNLMMRFPQNPDPRRMIRDLARLLKASRIG